MKELEGTTQQKGLLTELHCIQDFTELGYMCLTPVDDSCKYDIAVDMGNKIIKIQCKHSTWCKDTRYENEAFEIATSSITVNTKRMIRYKYKSSDVDFFYTWFNGKGYLVPISDATGFVFRLRYTYPKTNQKKRIHIASDYELHKVLNNYIWV